ncbi:hypothetical protein JCM8208_005478 [Rhodotorula glutinis]
MATKRRASASPAPAAAPTERIYPAAGPASAAKRRRLKGGDPGYDDQLAQGPPEKRLKQFKRDHQGPRRGRDGGWRFGYDDDWNGGFGR